MVCCDTGRRSSAGAFILNERGFNTHVLKGGLNRSRILAPPGWSTRGRVTEVWVGLSPAQRAGQIVFDSLLRVALVLFAELHADAGRALALGPLGVIQMTRPATGIFSSSPMRFSSMKTSSPSW